MFSKMRFSLAVFLLAAWACLADVAHSEGRMSQSVSGRRSRRMVGGFLAPNVPWQAMVYLGDSVLDGGYASGALISDRWVLTAGRNVFVRKSREHTQGQTPTVPRVFLGIVGRPEAVAANEVAVQRVVLHPGFQNQSDWENDLALIQLRDPVVFSDRVTAIPLPESHNKGHGFGVMAGWGWGALLTPAESLKSLVLPLSSTILCRNEMVPGRGPAVDDDTMFCTTKTRYNENVCFGDAGGALAFIDIQTEGVFAGGILSYDKACANGHHAVYMKISAYLPWIHSVIRGDTDQSEAVRLAAMKEIYSRAQRLSNK